jgi:uncharacterized membrane protein YhhN
MIRVIWWAALLAGASYMLPVLAGWDGPAITAWKGAGVGLLALWAALQVRWRDGWLIVLALACGAFGDVLLETHGLAIGGSAFALGHAFAIRFYIANLRENPTPSQGWLSVMLVPGSLVIIWAMLAPAPGWWHALVYTAMVAGMAAMAWSSRFPRYRTGIGAILFLASDLLIFAGEGGLVAPMVRSLLVWPLYFGGQALIAWGVVSTLRSDHS